MIHHGLISIFVSIFLARLFIDLFIWGSQVQVQKQFNTLKLKCNKKKNSLYLMSRVLLMMAPLY